jgi:8-oxo-dGTP diphosphatase
MRAETEQIDVLARGPWAPDAVVARWLPEPYVYDAAAREEAGRALASLAQRGSPSHEGISTRLAGWRCDRERLELELQEAPWSARLLEGDKHGSAAVVCLVRRSDGAWLAGRRAEWLAIWPGEWMLGGAGGLDPGEHPVAALEREVAEEWSAAGRDLTVEAVIRLPDGLIWIVGQVWLDADAAIVPDAEHDRWTWWPEDVREWPAGVRPELRQLGALVSSTEASDPHRS